MNDTPDELDDLRICDDCGNVYDYYMTSECPTCENVATVCQDCGGYVTLEVEWGEHYLSAIHYECQGCGRAGIAEVEPRG